MSGPSASSHVSVAILAQEKFLFERARSFSCSRAFWFCLVQVSTTQFCCLLPLPMARVSDGTNVPISSAPASSSNLGSPDGSLPNLEGPGFRASTMEEKINEIYLQLPLFMQIAARTVAAQTTKITNTEQVVGSLVARVTSLETNAASGSSSNKILEKAWTEYRLHSHWVSRVSWPWII